MVVEKVTQMPDVDLHIELWCRLLPEHTFNSGMAEGHLLYLQCMSGAAAFLRCAYTHSGGNAGQGCTVHTHLASAQPGTACSIGHD